MPPVEFEPIISAGERPQTYALDCAASGTGCIYIQHCKYPQKTYIGTQIKDIKIETHKKFKSSQHLVVVSLSIYFRTDFSPLFSVMKRPTITIIIIQVL